MRVVVGGWFTLPRLGRDAFALLMRQGVVYDKAMGFKLDPLTDIQSAVRTIRSATGEEVDVMLSCMICSRVACPGCPYLSVCDRTDVSPLCLCDDHSPDKSVFEAYGKAFLTAFS